MRSLLTNLKERSKSLKSYQDEISVILTKIGSEITTIDYKINEMETRHFYKLVITFHRSLHIQCYRTYDFENTSPLFNYEVDLESIKDISTTGVARRLKELLDISPIIKNEFKGVIDQNKMLYQFMVDASTGYSTSFKVDPIESRLLEASIKILLKEQK